MILQVMSPRSQLQSIRLSSVIPKTAQGWGAGCFGMRKRMLVMLGETSSSPLFLRTY